MRVRVKFTKNGNMKYIGHLDVMRYFQKVLRRADIDVSFSGGFSPHMIMSFAAPLGVGTTSSAEYFDLDLQSITSGQDMMDRMNAQMAQGMSVVGITQIKEDKASKGMSLVAAADYSVTLDLSECDPAIAAECLEKMQNIIEKVPAFMAQEEVNVWRKTKRSEAEVNIRPWIYKFRVDEKKDLSDLTNIQCNIETGTSCTDAGQKEYIFRMQVSQGSVSNLKPDLVVKAFADFAGFLIPEGSMRIHREEIYANIGSEKKRKLRPLGKLGEEI